MARGRVRDLWVNKRTGARTARWGTGLRWQAVWMVDGKERTRSFARKVDAEEWLKRTTAAINAGSWVDPAAGKVTVRSYGEGWLAKQIQLRPRSRTLYEVALRVRISPLIGHLPIATVDSGTVQALISDLAGRHAPTTVRATYTVLKAMFATAVSDQVVSRSPCQRVKLPPLAGRKAAALRWEHVAALAAALPSRLSIVPLLGATTGLRPSELLGLEVSAERGLDMLRRRILVRQQLLRGPNGRPYFAPLKTKASAREVPVTQQALDHLATYLTKFPAVEVKLEDRTDPHRPVMRPARLLVTSARGRPVVVQDLYRSWEKAVKAARVAVEADLAQAVAEGRLSPEDAAARPLPDRVTPHILRHTCASLMIDAGTHHKTVQAILGHATMAETMDTYSHLYPESDDRVRAAIDAAFASAKMRQVEAETEQGQNREGPHGL